MNYPVPCEHPVLNLSPGILANLPVTSFFVVTVLSKGSTRALSESKQVLFDTINTKRRNSQGMNLHGEFERITFSTIVCTSRKYLGIPFTLTSVPKASQCSLIYDYRLSRAHKSELTEAHAIQVDCSSHVPDGRAPCRRLFCTDQLTGVLGAMTMRRKRALSSPGGFAHEESKTGTWQPRLEHIQAAEEKRTGRGCAIDELAWDLGIVADAALDTTNVTMDW